MHPYKATYTPAATSAAGLASAVAWAAGGYALSATTMADSLAHIVTVGGLAATDHSAKTFTITGTDADGIAQTEGIAGPNGVATVSSTKYFKTVSSITVSSTTGADTFNLGWTAVAVSFTFPINWRQHNFGVSLGLVITGTISVTVQHCFEPIHESTVPAGLTWWSHATLVNATATADSNYAFPVTATRLRINSVTATATVTQHIVQGN